MKRACARRPFWTANRSPDRRFRVARDLRPLSASSRATGFSDSLAAGARSVLGPCRGGSIEVLPPGAASRAEAVFVVAAEPRELRGHPSCIPLRRGLSRSASSPKRSIFRVTGARAGRSAAAGFIPVRTGRTLRKRPPASTPRSNGCAGGRSPRSSGTRPDAHGGASSVQERAAALLAASRGAPAPAGGSRGHPPGPSPRTLRDDSGTGRGVSGFPFRPKAPAPSARRP
jgi:hypothetical protein